MDRSRMITDWVSGLPETPCGAGSKFENTGIIREYIPDVINRYKIKSIADVGCGDRNWIDACLPKNIQYAGFDVLPRFADVKSLDVSRSILPEKYDLVLCIYVLNHMKPDRAEDAIRLLKMSGSRFLLMSYSNADQYAVPGEPIESKFHKTRRNSCVTWKYGLWRLN